ncbi:hypothetical protein LP414_27595 [Polaromonas sp. P1(28)-13]|nr:hypothetical protein LP414_27595 [Polaromonas sp. P1(28)-13]
MNNAITPPKRSFAPVVTRRGSIFPFRNGRYFDCSAWGGGLFRLSGGPGACVLNSQTGTMLDIRSGEIYTDERFAATSPAGA